MLTSGMSTFKHGAHFQIDKRHVYFFAVSALVVSLRIASPSSGFLAYVLLAIYAASGDRQTLEAFLLSWFITMINPAITPEVQNGEFGRYLVILFAATSMLVRLSATAGNPKLSRGTVAALALGFFFILHSIFLSQMPTISVLKATVWLLVVLCVTGAAQSLSRCDMKIAEKNIFSFLISLAVVSLILIPTQAGYFRNGSGFQGLLNHPQVFGPLCAILLVRYLAMEISRKKISIANFSIIGFLAYLIFASQTRTALIAVTLAFFVSIFIALIRGKKIRVDFVGFLSPKGTAAVLFIPIALILSWSTLAGVVNNFIAKTTVVQELSLLDQYQTARGFLLERSISNIQDDPLVGIGFGVPSVDTGQPPTLDPIFGVPISLPVEKGNAFVAIIEEMGLVLGIWTLVWIAFRVLASAEFGIAAVMMSSVCLILNLGEAVFFSPGGQGMLVLLVFFMTTQRRMS